jgi:predicted nucleic acid-binding protein
LLVTEYVLWETVNALSKAPDRAKAHVLLEHVRTSGNYDSIAASPDLFEAGLRFHAERPDKDWSLTDCISFLVMQERNLTRALAYDHNFEQAGFEALLRRDPP